MESACGSARARAAATAAHHEGQESEAFAEFYRYAPEGHDLLPPGEQIRRVRPVWFCTAPISFRGEDSLRNEVESLKKHVAADDAFLTSTAPGSLEVYRRNEYYKSEEEFVYAIAEAMRVEYEMIAGSGVVLQVDDAWLPALWDRIGMGMGLEAFLGCEVRARHSTTRCATSRKTGVRYQLCWGRWHGPHAHDLDSDFWSIFS